MSIENWKKRYTVRSFDTSSIPSKEDIDYLCNIIEYIPSQLGAVDHIWGLLGPQDHLLKRWLVDNCYYTYDNKNDHKEYFTALAEAPYVFHSFKIKTVVQDVKPGEHIRNNAFHAGVLVCEAVNRGLGVAQICCVDGFKINNKQQEYKEKIWGRFSQSLLKIKKEYEGVIHTANIDHIVEPAISVAVGKGLPNTERDFTKYKDGVTFTGQKFQKWLKNIIT